MNNFSGHPKPQEPFGPSQELNGGEIRTLQKTFVSLRDLTFLC